MHSNRRWGARALWWLTAAGGCGGAEGPEELLRSCSYTNTFTETPECREYHGGWSEADAADECEKQAGSLVEGACAEPATLGTCVLAIAEAREVRIIFTGDDIGQCPVLAQACETFLRGEFVASEACEGHVDDPLPPEDGTYLLAQRPDSLINNLIGIVHGGVSSTGLELVASAAINSGQPPPLRTASIRVNFLRPFVAGARSRYEGTVVRVGRNSAIGDAQAVGDDGKVAIMARITGYR